MQDVNSHGRAQRSAKSINLEANILSEWCIASTVLHRQLKDRVLAIAVVLCIATGLVPALWNANRASERKLPAAQLRNAKALQALMAQDTMSKAAQPHQMETEVLTGSRANLQTLLGNVRLVIDAVPTSVAFDSVQAEVTDAQLTITCKSEAETPEAGQIFIDAASQGPECEVRRSGINYEEHRARAGWRCV